MKKGQEVEQSRVDVIVVGAGVAGAALASRLGRRGYRVMVLDRHEEAHPTIAGELLQPGGVEALQRLGLSECVEGIDAQPVYGFAVIDGDRRQCLAYPASPSASAARISENGEVTGSMGYSFHHHRFVGRLRESFLECPSVSFVQGVVQDLWIEEGRVCGVKLRAGKDQEQCIRAPLTVVASGRNTRLMGPLRKQHTPHRMAHSVGVLLRNTRLPFSHHGHVFFTSPSPTLGYQIDSDSIRLLVDFPGELPKQGNGELAQVLREQLGPQLPEELQGALEEALVRGNIQSMQSLSLLPEMPAIGGVAMLGDALNMRHPLTGGGMTVALNDVYWLCEAVESLGTSEALAHPAAVDAAVRGFFRHREPMAATIDMLSGALYEIFKAEQPGLVLMRDAVMRYWQLGGMAVSGPMSLLAGLRPSPVQLFLHYCAVALLGVGSHIAPSALPAEQGQGFQLPRLQHLRESSRLLLAAMGTLGHQLQRGLKLLQH